jgi:hypothetical protein
MVVANRWTIYMALVSRRQLSRSLQRNATIVSQEKLRDWVARLNTIRDDYVATEWEIILLESFSTLGKVDHEPVENGHIDVVFSTTDDRISFAADITAISDWSLHRKNPIDTFTEELRRQIRKRNLGGLGGFSYSVSEKRQHGILSRGRHRSALLPHVSSFRETIFNNKWDEFVSMIRANPTIQHTYHAFLPTSELTISFVMNLKGHITGSFGGYTGANVLTDNPLYNSLHKKAHELKRSRYLGPMGIIVCDGGCGMLTAPPTWDAYTVRDVVTEFFRQHRSIHFVTIISIKSNLSLNLPMKTSYTYIPITYSRSDATTDISSISEIIDQAVKRLPAIKRSPENVIYDLRWHRPKGPYRPYLGGWSYTASSLTISARELLEVISGKMPHALFKKNHEMANGGNSFISRVALGQQITGISLRRQADEDDDVVLLKFGLREDAKARTDKGITSQMSDRRINLRAKELLYFLAGTIGIEEFNKSLEDSNFFAARFAAGELFSDLTLHQEPCADNDRIVFSFGPPDPAVAPFCVPIEMTLA